MQKRVKELPFVKMQGIGNDYIYIDTFSGSLQDNISEEEFPDLSRKISDRHFGIGSDGLIVILPSDKADFQMRIFNADGSEAQMCGNGIRCVAKYVYERNMTRKTSLKIETLAGVKEIDLFIVDKHVKSIRVNMGKPILESTEIPVVGVAKGAFFQEQIKVKDKYFDITALSMGNPHCVVFVDELSDDLINNYGPLIENLSLFPERTNVEFVKIKDRKHIEMRVWERGSQETLACGTGACAAVVAAALNGFTGREVEVKLHGGKLKIEINEESDEVFMTGTAEFIAAGVYFYEVEI